MARGRAASTLLPLLALALAGCTVAPTAAPPSSNAPPPLTSGATTTTSPEPSAASASPGPLASSTQPSPTGSTSTGPMPTGQAASGLRGLVVKGRAPLTGYDRDRFGQNWSDVDRNGCDTRNDVLRRDLEDVVLKPGTNGCLVRSGLLVDPYTRATIRFVRGVGTSNAVQIDHVVALADAWQKGAFRWSDARRLQFANDPLNLLAVDGPTNLQKGASDAASWLPPVKAYRCAFVARQIAVKKAYGIWVTKAERDAMLRVLARCPGQKLPRG